MSSIRRRLVNLKHSDTANDGLGAAGGERGDGAGTAPGGGPGASNPPLDMGTTGTVVPICAYIGDAANMGPGADI